MCADFLQASTLNVEKLIYFSVALLFSLIVFLKDFAPKHPKNRPFSSLVLPIIGHLYLILALHTSLAFLSAK